MKCYTVCKNGVFDSIKLTYYDKIQQFGLFIGTKEAHVFVRLYAHNPPDLEDYMNTKRIRDAHPVLIKDKNSDKRFYVLAKPDANKSIVDKRILVLIITAGVEKENNGFAEFKDPNNELNAKKILIKTGPEQSPSYLVTLDLNDEMFVKFRGHETLYRLKNINGTLDVTSMS
jgi:hypothetical protein